MSRIGKQAVNWASGTKVSCSGDSVRVEAGKAVLEQIDVETREIAAMSRWMYEHPEFSLEEHATSDRCVEYLSARGFRITRGVADMTTAFVAEKGDADQLSDR